MRSHEKDSALESITGLNNSHQGLPKDFIGQTGQGIITINVPHALTPNHSLNEILIYARWIQASDVHICSGYPIVMRKFGSLKIATQTPVTAERVQTIIKRELRGDLVAEFERTGDLEFVHSIAGAGRFRLTLIKQRNGWELTARLITAALPKFEATGMPKSCEDLTKWAQGLVLVTGPVGCGKSTTLATLVEMINQTRHEHIITIENPIEIVYTAKQCQITQREVNLHTTSQAHALRAALREDPDILVVSELRDLESIQLAVSAAETGHLVFGTMNTNNASQTISRVIDSFPSDEQSVIRNMISESLRGIISQQLIPKKDGSGLVPAYEILVVNSAISNLIRGNKVTQMTNAITTGRSSGMILFDHSLDELVQKNVISAQEAFERAISPMNFTKYLDAKLTPQ